MKYIIPIFSLLAFCFYFSCDQVNPNLKDESPFKDDLEKLEKIDTLVKEIDKSLKNDNLEAIDINLVNAKDNLSYMPSSNNTSRLDLKIFPANTDAWVTFYLKDEKPVLFRYREWVKLGKPSAQETYTYFDDDGLIIYSETRAKSLMEGATGPLICGWRILKKQQGAEKRFILNLKNIGSQL